MGERYVVNKEGFLVDPETGEVVDELTYRLACDTPYTGSDTTPTRRAEGTTKPKPKPDVRKYLSSLLPENLREEFLSKTDGIKKEAEVFAYFVLLCREYGLIMDFDELREKLGLSKITLRKVRKKLVLQGKVRPWERVNPVFFEIAREIDRKNWLPAVLLAIEYERRGRKPDVEVVKERLFDEIGEGISDSYYLKYLIRNGKYSILGGYRFFKCPHGKTARIDYRKKKKEFRVRHLDGTECFYVSEKKVRTILSKMGIHYEMVKKKGLPYSIALNG
jgi:hypothetical protein